VEKCGRKSLQIIGALIMVASMISPRHQFYVSRRLHDRASLHVGLYSRLLHVMGSVTWVLLGEIFSNQIRGKAMLVAMADQWIVKLAVG
jgi:hypothetical protein